MILRSWWVFSSGFCTSQKMCANACVLPGINASPLLPDKLQQHAKEEEGREGHADDAEEHPKPSQLHRGVVDEEQRWQREQNEEDESEVFHGRMVGPGCAFIPCSEVPLFSAHLASSTGYRTKCASRS